MNDKETSTLIRDLQTNTALARIGQGELQTAIDWMLANGYTITRALPAVEVGRAN